MQKEFARTRGCCGHSVKALVLVPWGWEPGVQVGRGGSQGLCELSRGRELGMHSRQGLRPASAAAVLRCADQVEMVLLPNGCRARERRTGRHGQEAEGGGTAGGQPFPGAGSGWALWGWEGALPGRNWLDGI